MKVSTLIGKLSEVDPNAEIGISIRTIDLNGRSYTVYANVNSIVANGNYIHGTDDIYDELKECPNPNA